MEDNKDTPTQAEIPESWKKVEITSSDPDIVKLTMPTGKDDNETLYRVGAAIASSLNGDEGEIAGRQMEKCYKTLINGEEVRPSGVYSVWTRTSFRENERMSLVVENRNAKGQLQYQQEMIDCVNKVLGRTQDK